MTMDLAGRHIFQRDAQGVAHIVGLSGGKDSVCMAFLLREREPRPYTYVWTPTGDELPPMVEHMERVEGLLGSPIIRLTNGTLKSVMRDNNMLPSFHSRFCTRLLKLKPYGAFIEAAAPAISYIGLRADEDEDERAGARPGGDYAPITSNVQQDFPLRRWGMGIDDVWAYLASIGTEIPERSDCGRCPYQTIGELYNLWLYFPEIYDDAVGDETWSGHTFRSPTGKHGPWPAGLAALRVEFEKGRVPERSLRMMEKRRGMCRRCSL